jgi:hypothetical protein
MARVRLTGRSTRARSTPARGLFPRFAEQRLSMSPVAALPSSWRSGLQQRSRRERLQHAEGNACHAVTASTKSAASRGRERWRIG